MKKSLITTVCFICLLAVFSDLEAELPYSKGVNLTGWFQTSGPRQIQFTKYTREDFVRIKSLGCDVIRLPINLHFMTSGEPDYVLDPIFLNALDSAVSWAEKTEIHLILDNHSFDPAVGIDPSIEGILLKVWVQMAEQYKDRSDFISYEVLNEPHGISDALWGPIQGRVVDAIREVDTRHTIVVGGAGWNSYNNLQYLPVYDDDNLVYTFHFYDPFLFTHQGATWTDPSMGPLADVPFPYHPDSMPAFPDELNNTWIESSFNNYHLDGTVEKVKELLDIAIDFKTTRNVPIFCGEFGVYIPNSSHADRVDWYDTVRTYLELNDIAWTIWDYVGGFGIFEEGGDNLFDHDLDTALVRALGFNVPPQSEFISTPDTSGFPIYRDYIESQIQESGNVGTGTVDFYSETKPNNNAYCISWTGGPQYSSLGFNFSPNKDLSYLTAQDFALDLMIRGTSPGTTIDIRFLDTKTDQPDDHPWRMRYTLYESQVPWDGKWHHVYIPLSEFTEQGSWDGEWYNPIGAFDWTATDRFEIVAEHHDLEGRTVWFDNIVVTDRDTARIFDTSAVEIVNRLTMDQESSSQLEIVPNPVNDHAQIRFNIPETGKAELFIYDLTGRTMYHYRVNDPVPGIHTFSWDGTNAAGQRLKPGIYQCSLITSDGTQSRKILVR